MSDWGYCWITMLICALVVSGVLWYKTPVPPQLPECNRSTTGMILVCDGGEWVDPGG
jgi:hypothetical protein